MEEDTNRIRILDGGLGTSLQSLGHAINGDPLWSARLLFTDPDSVVYIHKKFAEHGSTVATTMSYQASVPGFMDELGLTVSEAMDLIGSSVELARKGFLESAGNNIVAGSVGPYGACKCDLSEYTGSYIDGMTVQDLMDWHRPRISSLVNAECDVLAFETIPACKEAEALMNLLREFPNMKAWLSFACKTADAVAHGEKFDESVAKCLSLDANKQLVAVGVNCCHPDLVHPLLKSSLRHLTPYCSQIAYPDSGQTYVEDNIVGENIFKHIDLHVKGWVEDVQVKWLGGCCFTTPRNISSVVNAVNQTLKLST